MEEKDITIKYNADTADVALKLDELIEKLERVKELFIDLGIKVETEPSEDFSCDGGNYNCGGL